MSKIVNIQLKNKKLTSSFGTFSFDQNGEANVPEEAFNEFIQLKGFFSVDAQDSEQSAEVPLTSDNVSPTEETSQEIPETSFSEEELEKLTVPQLKKIAREHGIDLTDASKKDEIIPLILGSSAE